ncbi:MAG: M56 family metallopeptidase [Rhodanobacteraceae bacterium]
MNLVDAIGWTLLHFLWQGALIGAIYGLLRTQLRSASARYILGLTGLAACALAPALTLWWLWPTQIDSAAMQRLPDLGVVAKNATSIDIWTRLDALLPWLVGTWIAGVIALGARSFWQWWGLAGARRGAVLVSDWQPRLTVLAARFGIDRPVALLATAAVQAPTLIGALKPVILLPTALLLRLPASQLELILAHELCHVRRWDYLVNLGQVVLETLLFYHPMVHWLSTRVRADRELCCDEAVLAVMGTPPRRYAEALADLAVSSSLSHIAPAANGGILVERIETLLLPPARKQRHVSALLLLMALTAAMLLAFGLRQRLAADSASAVTVPLSASSPRIAKMPARALPTPRKMVAAPQRQATAETTQIVPEIPFARSATHTFSVMPTRTARVPKSPTLSKDRHVAVSPAPSMDTAVARSLIDTAPLTAAPKATAPPLVSEGMKTDSASATNFQSPSVAEARAASASPAPAANASATPHVVHVVSPVYPDILRDRDLHGRVEMQFMIAADGSVQNIAVLDGGSHPQLANAAVTALRQWRFAPGSAEAGHVYRQAIDFSLADRSESCRIVTGSHICRHDLDAANAVGVKVLH